MAINAREDYKLLAKQADFGDRASTSLPGEALRALNELDRLRRWKEEASAVLSRWDAVADRFDLSGHLGEFSADAVGIEIDRLREKLI